MSKSAMTWMHLASVEYWRFDHLDAAYLSGGSKDKPFLLLPSQLRKFVSSRKNISAGFVQFSQDTKIVFWYVGLVPIFDVTTY